METEIGAVNMGEIGAVRKRMPLRNGPIKVEQLQPVRSTGQKRTARRLLADLSDRWTYGGQRSHAIKAENRCLSIVCIDSSTSFVYIYIQGVCR